MLSVLWPAWHGLMRDGYSCTLASLTLCGRLRRTVRMPVLCILDACSISFSCCSALLLRPPCLLADFTRTLNTRAAFCLFISSIRMTRRCAFATNGGGGPAIQDAPYAACDALCFVRWRERVPSLDAAADRLGCFLPSALVPSIYLLPLDSFVLLH